MRFRDLTLRRNRIERPGRADDQAEQRSEELDRSKVLLCDAHHERLEFFSRISSDLLADDTADVEFAYRLGELCVDRLDHGIGKRRRRARDLVRGKMVAETADRRSKKILDPRREEFVQEVGRPLARKNINDPVGDGRL